MEGLFKNFRGGASKASTSTKKVVLAGASKAKKAPVMKATAKKTPTKAAPKTTKAAPKGKGAAKVTKAKGSKVKATTAKAGAKAAALKARGKGAKTVKGRKPVKKVIKKNVVAKKKKLVVSVCFIYLFHR